MADPLTPTSTPGSQPVNTNPIGMTANQGMTPTGQPTSPSSSSGGDFLGSLVSDLSSFFTSPLGNLTEFSALAGLGLSQANQQKGENDQLASSLSKLGAPFSDAATGTLTQLEGGAQAPGPAGSSVADQTTAAAGLGKIASTAISNYQTGQLQPWQQQQIEDFKKSQRALIDSQLAASGNTDSSAKDAAYQQIDQKAMEMASAFNAQDLQVGEQALTQVQTTYTNLINQMLSEASFGFGTQSEAVQLQIQSDTQLSQSLNQLFAGIAQGFGEAMRGPSGGGAGASGGSTNTTGLLNQLQKLLGGSSGPTPDGTFTGGTYNGPAGGYDPGGVQSLFPAGSDTGIGGSATSYAGVGGDAPLYSGATGADVSGFSGSFPTSIGGVTDVPAVGAAADAGAAGGGAVADLGGAGATAAGADAAFGGGGAAAGGGAATDAVVSEWSQPVGYQAATDTAAADTGSTAAASSSSGGAAAGTAAGALALFAAQFAAYEADPVGTAADQSSQWISSLDGNPQWQPLVDRAKAYMASHGGALDRAFWESEGVDFSKPLGNTNQPSHSNARP